MNSRILNIENRLKLLEEQLKEAVETINKLKAERKNANRQRNTKNSQSGTG